jgi:hypothetical protein
MKYLIKLIMISREKEYFLDDFIVDEEDFDKILDFCIMNGKQKEIEKYEENLL